MSNESLIDFVKSLHAEFQALVSHLREEGRYPPAQPVVSASHSVPSNEEAPIACNSAAVNQTIGIPAQQVARNGGQCGKFPVQEFKLFEEGGTYSQTKQLDSTIQFHGVPELPNKLMTYPQDQFG